jgi:2-C-methyl-D-erythritol 2,4-cyclodiphosphate synthase
MFRIGHGFDTHAFEVGKALILGGVTIPYPMGMKAHSDGDVILHAVCDSLLGAAALGDIGQHFPDNDAQFKNADSRHFLRYISRLVTDSGYQISNLDVTVLAEKPKLAPHVLQMRMNVAEDLSLSLDAVNIKATTTEKMGFVGREEGIACHAVALIFKQLIP